MASKKYPNKKRVQPTKKKQAIKPKLSLLENLDLFFEKKTTLVFWLGLGIALLFSLLLFDLKVSVGGDDAAYLIRASDFATDFIYPAYQGPLYPFLLSPIIALFGLKLGILKLSSLIFMLLALFVFYYAFRKRVAPSILALSFIIMSGNAYLLYFSSQTYSEALFMLLQSLLLLVVFKNFIDNEKISWKDFALIGLILFLMTITKNIGFIALLAVIAYFSINKQWKNAAFSSVSFVGFIGLWEIIKRIVWSTSELQMSSQASTLFLKHPYDPTQGKEDLVGFFMRFIENSNIYLSKHLLTFFGFRPEITQTMPILTIIVYSFFFLALYFAFKQNKYLLFTGFYLLFMLGATFFALQTIWDGRRLISPYYIPSLLFLFSGIYYLFTLKKTKLYSLVFPVIALIFIFVSYKISLEKIDKNSINLRQNFKGNTTYGLSPDWQNYIKMSKWAAENVTVDVKIGARKPSISFVNTGRRFHGMYKVPVLHLDSLIKKCSQLRTEYIIIETNQWENKSNLQNYYLQIQKYNIGYLTEFWKPDGASSAQKSVVFEVYEITEKAKPIFEILENSKLVYIKNIDDLLKQRKQLKEKMPDWTINYIVTAPDDLLQNLYDNNVRYVIMANLRKYEQQKSEYTINTVRRYLFYIQRKYPFKIRQVHKIGKDEEAYLFEIL